MAKKVVVKICEFINTEGIKFTVDRVFLVPECYLKLQREEFSRKLLKLSDKPHTFLIAHKFGEADVKTPLFFYDFKAVTGVYMQDTSDWFLQPMFDEFDLDTLDRRVDPMILLLGDKKRLKFRINYYLDLLERGYSEDEAMNTIF